MAPRKATAGCGWGRRQRAASPRPPALLHVEKTSEKSSISPEMPGLRSPMSGQFGASVELAGAVSQGQHHERCGSGTPGPRPKFHFNSSRNDSGRDLPPALDKTPRAAADRVRPSSAREAEEQGRSTPVTCPGKCLPVTPRAAPCRRRQPWQTARRIRCIAGRWSPGWRCRLDLASDAGHATPKTLNNHRRRSRRREKS